MMTVQVVAPGFDSVAIAVEGIKMAAAKATLGTTSIVLFTIHGEKICAVNKSLRLRRVACDDGPTGFLCEGGGLKRPEWGKHRLPSHQTIVRLEGVQL